MFPALYFPRRYFPGRYFTPDTETTIEEGWTILVAEPAGDTDDWVTITPPGEE
jgi:hypothetical protein